MFDPKIETFGGHTLEAIHEFVAHSENTGESIDQITMDDGTSAAIIKDMIAKLAAPMLAVHSAGQEALFWYRPCADGLYEGPHHANSELGKMLRAEKPEVWKPLYTAPVNRINSELIDMLIEVLDKVPLTDSTRMVTPTATKARAVIAKARAAMQAVPVNGGEPANLEGLRTALLDGRPVARDAEGWYCHPALPVLDENIDTADFLAPFGIEAVWVSMQDSDEADIERYTSDPDAGCAFWTPATPLGEGWTILSIHDHEDGPFALFARRAAAEPKRAADAPQMGALKDHEFRELVSSLTVIGQVYGNTQQLRERIRSALSAALTSPAKVGDDALTYDQAEQALCAAYGRGWRATPTTFSDAAKAGRDEREVFSEVPLDVSERHALDSACADIAAVYLALGLPEDDAGGADAILEAIEELKSRAALSADGGDRKDAEIANLKAVAKEYDDLIHYMNAGGDFFEFCAATTAKGEAE